MSLYYMRQTRVASESDTCVHFYPFAFLVTMSFHSHPFIYPLFSVCQFAGVIFWKSYTLHYYIAHTSPKHRCNSILLVADTTDFKRKSIKCVWLVFYQAKSPQYIERYLLSCVHSESIWVHSRLSGT